ncbi:hypothetical protein [Nocardia nova]|nr:hypothetical protein [Nocardia nova]
MSISVNTVYRASRDGYENSILPNGWHSSGDRQPSFFWMRWELYQP